MQLTAEDIERMIKEVRSLLDDKDQFSFPMMQASMPTLWPRYVPPPNMFIGIPVIQSPHLTASKPRWKGTSEPITDDMRQMCDDLAPYMSTKRVPAAYMFNNKLAVHPLLFAELRSS